MFVTLLLVEKKPRILLPISLFLGRLQPFPLIVVISGIYSGRGNLRKFSSFAQLVEKLDETVCWLKVSFGARGAFLLDQAQKNRFWLSLSRVECACGEGGESRLGQDCAKSSNTSATFSLLCLEYFLLPNPSAPPTPVHSIFPPSPLSAGFFYLFSFKRATSWKNKETMSVPCNNLIKSICWGDWEEQVNPLIALNY